MIISAAYDWVKNCACIADFYQSMDKQQIAALALSSAHKVFHEKVMKKSKENASCGIAAEGEVTEQDCVDLNSEINKKWIKLDMKMMKIAFEIETERVLAIYRGEPFTPQVYGNDLDDLHMFQDPGPEVSGENIPSQHCELSTICGNDLVKDANNSDVILDDALVDQSTISLASVKQVPLFSFSHPVFNHDIIYLYDLYVVYNFESAHACLFFCVLFFFSHMHISLCGRRASHIHLDICTWC